MELKDIIIYVLSVTSVAALVVATLLARALRDAKRDGLTGLLTRKFIQKEVERLAKQVGTSLLIIDVDGLKAINDERRPGEGKDKGHKRGDIIIQIVAAVIARNIRSVGRLHPDLAGRWGGDEFTVILEGTGIGDALAIAERIRAEVEEVGRKLGQKITVSIGVATTGTETIPDFDHLYMAADSAVYLAKEAGRNIVKTIGG